MNEDYNDIAEQESKAATIAYHCVRNTILEDIHANGGISQREMMALMMEVTANIAFVLQEPEFLELLRDSPITSVPPYWQSAPFASLVVDGDRFKKWSDSIINMSDEKFDDHYNKQYQCWKEGLHGKDRKEKPREHWVGMKAEWEDVNEG